MLSHKTITEAYKEIKFKKKEINKFRTKTLNDVENIMKKKFTFCNKYPRLFRKLISNNLNKFIPKMIRLHKSKSKGINKKFSKKFPELYKEIRKGNLLSILREIKSIKSELTQIAEPILHQLKQKQIDMKTYFESKYPAFKTKANTLFQGMLSGNLNEKTLEVMLNMYKKYEDKKLSERDASIQFGTHLVDKYIKPNLPEVSEEEKKRIDAERNN